MKPGGFFVGGVELLRNIDLILNLPVGGGGGGGGLGRMRLSAAIDAKILPIANSMLRAAMPDKNREAR